MKSEPLREALIARHRIMNVLALHSRGVDRADGNLIAAAYHADATVDYGFFQGPAATLATILADAQKAGLPTLHRTSNIAIRLAGDHALSEAYVMAYAEEPDIQRMVFGRYLDRHERRDGVWRLVHRRYVLDSNSNRPNNATRPDPAVLNDHFVPRGGKGAADPGRTLLAYHEAASRHLQDPPAMTIDIAELNAALARDAIRQLLTLYCRGADRADADLIASAFWEDATVVSGVTNGSAAQFAQDVAAHVAANLDACFHSIANEWIEVRGDHAVGEHYVIAHSRGDGQETLTGGRYIDSYERRGDTWKIASRSFVCDWTSTQPATFESGGFYEALALRGSMDRDDPIYAHWASL